MQVLINMARVGIVGAGLIGNKRAAALQTDDQINWICDLSLDRAKELAQKFNADYSTDWESLISKKTVDVIIVSTSNNSIAPVASLALKNGISVLVEKPAGRHPGDVQQVINAARESKGIVRVGFNHRFHPAMLKAKEMIENGAIGEFMYIRARYGHGGRIGYDKEWRANPELSGGGELLDQGVHLIDLTRWFGGEFNLEFGRCHTFFWDMPVEDNGFLLLTSADRKRYAHLHASCTEWKNLFDFEIFGKTGKLQIWGIGRSYGTEELRYYRMLPEMGPPEIKIETFPGEDLSWKAEWTAFKNEISGKTTPIAKIEDALRAVELVHSTYAQSKR